MPKGEMAVELGLFKAFGGGQGYLPVMILPRVQSGKRDSTLQGALLILECGNHCSYT